MSKHHSDRIAVALAVVLCAGCTAAGPLHSEPFPVVEAPVPQRLLLASNDRPRLYVGSHKLSEYALDSTEPLRSTKINYNVSRAVLALDPYGNLVEANGNPSYQQILVYDARTLRLVRTLDGIGWLSSLVADRFGYLYAAGGGNIVVLAPGATRIVGTIRRGANSVDALAFDAFGNLYAASMHSVGVYAPTAQPGHMKFVRHIREGINTPYALALGPSGELFVGNWPSKSHGWVSVYAPGGSTLARKITSGINAPLALAVDSKGRLYVGNTPLRGPHQRKWRGWVSVYGPGSTQPLRKITDGVYTPGSLAVGPAGDLYVANIYAGVSKGPESVTVYDSGGSQLLRSITEGINGRPTVLIGSP